MIYRVLADLVVLIHLAFIAVRRRRSAPGVALAAARVGAHPRRDLGTGDRGDRVHLPAHSTWRSCSVDERVASRTTTGSSTTTSPASSIPAATSCSPGRSSPSLIVAGYVGLDRQAPHSGVMTAASLRHRFPGVRDGWARFDGPAGHADGRHRDRRRWPTGRRVACNANSGGAVRRRRRVRRRCSSAPGRRSRRCSARRRTRSCFGANMTTLTLAFTRAVALTLRPGDRVVGTRLDHDANVTPWRLACEASGAEHVLAPFDPATGLLDPAAVDRPHRRAHPLGGRHRRVEPDRHDPRPRPDRAPPPTSAGARVFVDAVHLAPHRRIDVAALGCDALVTSPYKWYGPHAGVLVRPPGAARRAARRQGPAGAPPTGRAAGRPARRASRRSPPSTPRPQFLLGRGDGPHRRRRGGGVRAAARRAGSRSTGSGSGARRSMADARRRSRSRSTGKHPDEVAAALAGERIATWAGHSYAVEVVDQLGLADKGGVVRAGVVAYIDARRRRPPARRGGEARGYPLTASSMRARTSLVEPRDHVEGGEVLGSPGSTGSLR